ncbi:MAG: sugar phosphate isomerase/epimerase family protein [Anaerovorax sp.]|nr:sugar phosphate isomerase/epimerase family protein [Anaerovorax sp.]
MASIKREQIVGMNQHYRRFSFDYFLDCQQKLGVQNIELWCGSSHFWLDHQGYGDITLLKRKLEDHNMKIVSVTSPSCAYQYQYASQEPDGLKKSFQYFKNGIRLAAQLEAKCVVVNSGWGYWNEDPDVMWERSRENLRKLAEVAAEEGVYLVMESLRTDESNIVNSLQTSKKMYDEVNHPNLKMMVDTIATGAAGESLTDWFETFGKDLIHMHFLDGDPYVHNAWGDGNTPLESQLQVLNDWAYEGYLVQEIADESYFSDPFAADIKNIRVLERFIVD